jgi:hypothetical protein
LRIFFPEVTGLFEDESADIGAPFVRFGSVERANNPF